ncbi:hypothetical protein A2U01_0105077 [Trifolium medium]|uniref:Uncharacterized protein n=1 Tax=Trifolium medium TaxID=97028 RepID=A0A392VA43_9FABA|nr:hypothetical protein [Trifolium medium]
MRILRGDVMEWKALDVVALTNGVGTSRRQFDNGLEGSSCLENILEERLDDHFGRFGMSRNEVD